ncbi:YqhG family protein [Bacillus sonorensis]|nr:YqhG family protein [Bacillus sonorensis]
MGGHTPLEPWLGLNVTISFQSDMKKTSFCLSASI